MAVPTGFRIVAAYEQDHAAADTHEGHFGVPVERRDLGAVTAADLDRWQADTWLLSPPCQPFTRRGRKRDVDDPRCRGLLRFIELLPRLAPRRVLLENVPGFFGSRAHALLESALRALDHDVHGVETCPTEMGEPVRRRRQFVVSSVDGLAALPPLVPTSRQLADLLDPEPARELTVPDEVRARVADHLPMPGPDGVLGTFTRSYGRAITGAGPVLWTEEGPRYLSPDEILRVHGFPATFTFPAGMSLRTRWRLAGNTVHVPSVRRVAAMLARAETETVPDSVRH